MICYDGIALIIRASTLNNDERISVRMRKNICCNSLQYEL